MSRVVIQILIFLFLFTPIIASAEQAASENKQPNVIFILVDDQGYYDLGCYGAREIDTPNIDRMAKEGTLFTDYYAAAPICSASRAGLLTGCYPRRIGNHIWVHRADSNYGIHPDELTIAELFKQSGYSTACIGKWHLGFHDAFLPRNQGFDHYFGLLHNLDPVEVIYFEKEGGVPLIRNGKQVKRPVDPAELTRLYTDEAIDFIRSNQSDPFFLYLPHTMLHVPLGVSRDFQGSSDWGQYGDAIQELDHHVGRLFTTLTELNLSQNTIIVYTSDNGRGPGRDASQPLRGNKLTTWEAGIRVPAIAWGPGSGIKQGLLTSEPVRAMDWFPTLATLADISIPKGPVIDGRDITPLLQGQATEVPAPGLNKSLNAAVPLRRRWEPAAEWAQLIKRQEYNDAFFYHGSEGTLSAVRWKNWKLTINPNLTLYDLSLDPSEKIPVRNRDIIRKLRGMVVLFQEEMRQDARAAGIQQDSNTPQTPAASSKLFLNSKTNVKYANYGNRTLEMDIYRPKDSWGPLPAIVCIHGGGWAKGTRLNHTKIAMALASRGFVAATISYRLSGEAPFPAQIHDCKAAVRFLRAQSTELGINPKKIGAIGLSAGGHLTALLATSGGVESLEGGGGHSGFSSTIQAAIAMGAQTDLLSEQVRVVAAQQERGEIWRQFLGGTQEHRRSVYKLASPIEHLNSNDPPIWFITGQNDDPSTRAVRFRDEMTRLGIRTGLTVIKEAPHAILARQPWFEETINEATRHFRWHLSN
ncbi:MAG: N-acetylgalactosamine-6-sulfatase [Planctomycetaceae bacterium]|nr:N-acetylgalactosamine-6-sulfatase [Planctomycetaceae bacterium]